MKLIIIAAGEGSRLRTLTTNVPKTLLRVNGRPVLSHLLDNALRLNIEGVVVVTGFQAAKIEDHLSTWQNESLTIETVYNPDWKLSNGISVLAARPHIPQGEPFMISMSDHIYGPDLLRLVHSASMGRYSARVGLDFKLDQIYDMDDAMKVEVDASVLDRVTAMSKTLSTYQAVDCGLFQCAYSFMDHLATVSESGDASLADACNAAITEGTMGGIDIGNLAWQDVDTPEAYAHLDDPGVLQRIL